MTREGSTKTLPRNSKILWQQPRSRPESYAEPGDGGKEIESIAASRSSSNINQGMTSYNKLYSAFLAYFDKVVGQQRRQPSRYRHRTERGRRERRENESRRSGRSRSRGKSEERGDRPRSESRGRSRDYESDRRQSLASRPRSRSRGRSQSRGRHGVLIIQ